MKKWIVSIVAACSLLVSGVAIGESINGSFNGNPIVKVQSGGKIITDEVPAQIIVGKTMVPLTMLRSLGFDVVWNPNDYSVNVKQHHELTDAEIAQISKSVGIIYAYDKNGKALKQGSGVVITDNGLLVTNHHVISGTDHCEFTVDGKKYSFNTSSYAFDSFYPDLYGVYLQGYSGSHIDLQTQAPNEGDKVTAIGYPLERYSVTNGVFLSKKDGFINHTIKMNPGYSGGALINQDGKLLGLTDADNSAVIADYIQLNINMIAGLK